MSRNPPTPTALTVAQMAKVLSAAGGRRVTEEMIRADIDAGAPVNADGTLNLVHYAAWLTLSACNAQAGRAMPAGRQEVAGGD